MTYEWCHSQHWNSRKVQSWHWILYNRWGRSGIKQEGRKDVPRKDWGPGGQREVPVAASKKGDHRDEHPEENIFVFPVRLAHYLEHFSLESLACCGGPWHWYGVPCKGKRRPLLVCLIKRSAVLPITALLCAITLLRSLECLLSSIMAETHLYQPLRSGSPSVLLMPGLSDSRVTYIKTTSWRGCPQFIKEIKAWL